MTNRRLRWVAVPCTSMKALRTDSQKGIGEILNSKLATIIEEEPENLYEGNNNNNADYNTPMNINTKITNNNNNICNNMKLWFKGKKGKDLVRNSRLLFKRSRLQIVSHYLCVKGTYIDFLADFVGKGSLTGLSRY